MTVDKVSPVNVLGVKSVKALDVVRLLLVLDLVVSTRAFALSNFIEFILVLLILFIPTVRTEFLKSFSDIRIQILSAFALWIVIACLWGDAPILERMNEILSWRKLFLFPLAFAVFSDRHWKLASLFGVVGIATIYMVSSWLGWAGYLELDRPPTHLLENHATQGFVFGVACLAIFFISKTIVLGVVQKAILFAIFLGLAANIFFLLPGRTGYLFTMVALGLAFFYCQVNQGLGYLRRSLLVALLGVGGILFFSEVFYQRLAMALAEITSFNDVDAPSSSMGMRMVMWSNTISLIANGGLFGTGSGSFALAYAQLVDGVEGWRGTVSDDPHNQYLHIAAEQGLIGLGIFLLWLLVVVFRTSWGSCSITRFGFCLLAGVAATSLANGHFSSFVEGRYLYILLGISLAGSSCVSLKGSHCVFR